MGDEEKEGERPPLGSRVDEMSGWKGKGKRQGARQAGGLGWSGVGWTVMPCRGTPASITVLGPCIRKSFHDLSCFWFLVSLCISFLFSALRPWWDLAELLWLLGYLLT